MGTNTIFINIYNGTNIYMNINRRRHIERIHNTEQKKRYDIIHLFCNEAVRVFYQCSQVNVPLLYYELTLAHDERRIPISHSGGSSSMSASSKCVPPLTEQSPLFSSSSSASSQDGDRRSKGSPADVLKIYYNSIKLL